MRDDTRGSQASSAGFEFSSNIDDILKHQVHRTRAARWARNLRFLTFGGDESSTDTEIPKKSNPTQNLQRGQCTRCELRIPPPAGHICASHTPMMKRDIGEYEKQAKEYNYPCIHVEDASCEECMHIPLFPNHGKTTQFCIRRLKPKGTKQCDLGMCTHFVAVSYCWSSSNAQKPRDSNTDDEPYQVLEEDMETVRPIRAPKDTIDRAVNFAAQNGFRMIWIDQECIEQDNKEEKELGIQAMDYVYTNAQMSIGLFQVTLEQRHLDALLFVFESTKGSEQWHQGTQRRGPKPPGECRSIRINTLAEALGMIVMDRWNTRAWIFQESFVSCGHMILLLPRAKEIAVKGWSMVCHDRSLTEIGIALDMLQWCVGESTALLMPKLGSTSPVILPNWAETLERLSWFHPERSGWHRPTFWINSSKPRHTCNAAVAWSFLKHRDSERVADRLAILANLCDYSLRLNTWELEKSQSRLSVCILAMTIANGDFSMLSPESYRFPRELHITQNKGDKDFTWVPSDVKQLQYIRMRDTDPEGATLGRASPHMFGATNEGLSFFGFMWKIDHFVEVTSIRDKYKESWSRLWRSTAKLEEQSREATGKAPNFHAMTRVRCLAATQIMFEVIKLLHKENQTEIADAIWHSVTDIEWRKGGCFDSFAKVPEQVTVEKRKGMFHLDPSQNGDGHFQQKWLIDRIMFRGGFWVGRLVRRSTDREYSDGTSTEDCENDAVSGDDQVDRASQDRKWEDGLRSPAQGLTELDTETSGAATVLQTDDIPRKAGQRSSLAGIVASLDPATPFSGNKGAKSFDSHYKSGNGNENDIGKDISNNQFTRSMMMKLLDDAMKEWDDSEELIDDPIHRDRLLGALPETLAEVLVMVHDLDGRNSPAYLRRQRAIFDMEGDTPGNVLVLTPFQKRLETIPRPENRGLSVSWVVQPVPHVDGSEDKGGSGLLGRRETLKTTGMVRGMWKIMVQPTNRYVLV